MPNHFHHVPGRLRVYIPSVKGSTTNAKALEQTIAQLKGVSHVEGRALTGSVVVHYDAQTLDSTTLLAALKVNGPTLASRKVPSPDVKNQIAAHAAKAVAGYALEKALERGFTLLLTALL